MWDLQQHLLLGTVAKGVMHKDDLTAAACELLQQHHLIGVAPRRPIGAPDKHRVKGPSRRKIAQAIGGGAIEARPAGVLIHEHAPRWALVGARLYGVVEGVELTLD